MTEGILTEIDGRPALRLTRRLAHPIERVWRAVSTYDELAAWFVGPVDFKEVGQRFEAMEQPAKYCVSRLLAAWLGNGVASNSPSTWSLTGTARC